MLTHFLLFSYVENMTCIADTAMSSFNVNCIDVVNSMLPLYAGNLGGNTTESAATNMKPNFYTETESCE